MKTYSSKEIMEQTGITPRNMKFWIKEYNLQVIRKGRQNHFDKTHYTILKVINLFSKNNFFTGKLLNLYLNKIKNADDKEINDFKNFVENLIQIEKENGIENTLFSLFTDSYKKTISNINNQVLPDELL